MASDNDDRDISTASLTPDSERALWLRWRENGDDVARKMLMEHHLPYAKIIAAKTYAGRISDEFEFDEYLQFATIALIECLDRYNPDLGAQFRTYSYLRIIGAILNGLEHLSDRQEQISLQRRLKADRLSSAKEMSPTSKKDSDKLFSYLAEVGIGLALGIVLDGSNMLADEERWIPDQNYERLELKQLSQRVRQLIKRLTERESQVIYWHYLQAMSFDDIAKKLGISNARVSQLHYQGLQRLRNMLNDDKPCDVAW